MEPLQKLRMLIWDKDYNVFLDDELEEFLKDSGGEVYGAAAIALNVVSSNPEKFRSYSIGGLSFTYVDLDKAIEKYEAIATKEKLRKAGHYPGSFYTTRMRRDPK